MATVQQVQTPKYIEITPPQAGNSISCEVRDIQVTVDQTCSRVGHVDVSGASVTWAKSNHVFPAYGAGGWKETWTPPSGTTYRVEYNGQVCIYLGRDASVYDAILKETTP